MRLLFVRFRPRQKSHPNKKPKIQIKVKPSLQGPNRKKITFEHTKKQIFSVSKFQQKILFCLNYHRIVEQAIRTRTDFEPEHRKDWRNRNRRKLTTTVAEPIPILRKDSIRRRSTLQKLTPTERPLRVELRIN